MRTAFKTKAHNAHVAPDIAKLVNAKWPSSVGPNIFQRCSRGRKSLMRCVSVTLGIGTAEARQIVARERTDAKRNVLD